MHYQFLYLLKDNQFQETVYNSFLSNHHAFVEILDSTHFHFNLNGSFQPNSTRVQNQCSQFFYVSMREVFPENCSFIP